MSQPSLFQDNSEEDTFEGEETLIAGSIDKSPPDQEAIYPDAIVSIVTESASVFQLKRKYDKTPSLIRLDPDFQRHSVWTIKQKSELIESILMGIPLPLIYVKEDDAGIYIIVDGRQRLSTLFEFLNNGFELNKLTVLSSLNGDHFNTLSQAQQSKIEDCSLTLQVIKPPTPDRITFDLFDRVNRGGTQLNNQEMRNAIYQGPATQLLKKLSDYESFRNATENAIKSNRMKDKYLILRLIGFYLWRKGQLIAVKEPGFPKVEYRSDLEDFLGKTMLFLNHDKGNSFCASFPELFDKAMNICIDYLDAGCFRLPNKKGETRRPINMALFETVSYLIIEMIDKEPDLLRKAYAKLLTNNEFIQSIDSDIEVKIRFETIETLIKDFLPYEFNFDDI